MAFIHKVPQKFYVSNFWGLFIDSCSRGKYFTSGVIRTPSSNGKRVPPLYLLFGLFQYHRSTCREIELQPFFFLLCIQRVGQGEVFYGIIR